jgi:hypothetical protein
MNNAVEIAALVIASIPTHQEVKEDACLKQFIQFANIQALCTVN